MGRSYQGVKENKKTKVDEMVEILFELYINSLEGERLNLQNFLTQLYILDFMKRNTSGEERGIPLEKLVSST